MNDNIEIATTLPATDGELQERLRALRAWKQNTVATITANTTALTADNYRREKLNAFDGADKRLKEFADAVGHAAMPDWAKAILVEVVAARADVKSACEERKDALRALKDANEPKPEQFEYILEIKADQKTAEAVFKKLDKDNITYRARRVKDGESAKVAKLFD